MRTRISITFLKQMYEKRRVFHQPWRRVISNVFSSHIKRRKIIIKIRSLSSFDVNYNYNNPSDGEGLINGSHHLSCPFQKQHIITGIYTLHIPKYEIKHTNRFINLTTSILNFSAYISANCFNVNAHPCKPEPKPTLPLLGSTYKRAREMKERTKLPMITKVGYLLVLHPSGHRHRCT